MRRKGNLLHYIKHLSPHKQSETFHENPVMARLQDILRRWGPADPRNILKRSGFPQGALNRKKLDWLKAKLLCNLSEFSDDGTWGVIKIKKMPASGEATHTTIVTLHLDNFQNLFPPNNISYLGQNIIVSSWAVWPGGQFSKKIIIIQYI